MDKATQEKILGIIESAPEAYRRKEKNILSRAIGSHAAYMGRCGEKENHQRFFYWNYFGGKNKEYRCFSKDEARPLPFLIPEEINELYALVASKNPALVASGVVGQAISVLVQNCWKENKFKLEVGDTKPSSFCCGLERKCTIEINGDVGYDSLQNSKGITYFLHGSVDKNSVQALHNCTIIADKINGGIEQLFNCTITAERIGGDGYSIAYAHHSCFNVGDIQSGIHGNHIIVDAKNINGDIRVENSVVFLRGSKIPDTRKLPFQKFYDVDGKNSKLITFDKQLYDFWHTTIKKNIKDFKTNRHTLSYYPIELILAQGKKGRGKFGTGLGYIEGEERT